MCMRASCTVHRVLARNSIYGDGGRERVERVERAESRIESQPATQEGSARPTADTSGWCTLPLALRLPREIFLPVRHGHRRRTL